MLKIAVLDLRGAEPVRECPTIQQRRQQRVPTLAQRQHQRQLVAVEHLGERLGRVNTESHTALVQGGDDLLLGARRPVREHLLDRLGYLTQRRGHAHPTDATHPAPAAVVGRAACRSGGAIHRRSTTVGVLS
jgi:hypothetical protein